MISFSALTWLVVVSCTIEQPWKTFDFPSPPVMYRFEELLDAPTSSEKYGHLANWILAFDRYNAWTHGTEFVPERLGKWTTSSTFSCFWIKSGSAQMRPDCGFAFFTVRPDRWSTMHPAECRHACHFASSRGESEMESWTMSSSLSEMTCDQSTSLESFCVVTPLKMPTSQTSGAVICENLEPIWRYWSRICRHRIPVNWCCENGDGISYQCLQRR